MAVPSPPRLEGRDVFFFFLLFPVSMGPTLCVLCDSRFFSSWIIIFFREDSLDDCGRPCDPLSCFIFSALWLRCSQSLLVQVIQSGKDLDLTCSTTFLFRDATCLQAGPMSLDCPVNPFGRSDSSRPSLPPDVPSGEQQRGAFPASERSRWRQDALHAQQRCYNILQGGMDVAPSFPKAYDVFLGTPGASLDLFLQDKGTESPNSIISKDSLTPTTFYVSKRCMERMSIFRLFICWLRDFCSLVLFFLVTKTREDRLSASTGIFFLKTQL